MSFVYSRFAFNGYTFPASFFIESRESAMQRPEVRLHKTKGSIGIQPTYAAKEVRIKGTIGGWGSIDSAGAFITTLDQAKAELNLMVASALDGSGLKNLTAGDSDLRTLSCQCKDVKVSPYESTRQMAIDVELIFEAPDPRWLSAASTTVAASTSSYTGTYAGSAPTYPVFTHVGPTDTNTVTQVQFIIDATGSQPKGIAFPNRIQPALTQGLQLSGGHTLVLDCRPQNRANFILYDGAFAPDLLTTWQAIAVSQGISSSDWLPTISPGAFSIYQIPCAAGGSFTISWQNAYWY